jgi:hypothetical protein
MITGPVVGGLIVAAPKVTLAEWLTRGTSPVKVLKAHEK